LGDFFTEFLKELDITHARSQFAQGKNLCYNKNAQFRL